MYGQGAVATLYGWALAEAGHRVEFWERPGEEGWEHTVTLHGLDARHDPRGRPLPGAWAPQRRGTGAPDPDLIVVGVRHDRLAAALTEAAALSPRALVLAFGNVWDDLSLVAGGLDPARLVWGFPSAGGHYDEADLLVGALLAPVHLGQAATELSAAERVVADLWTGAGFRVQLHTGFQGWLWLNFAVAAGLGAQAAAAGGAEELMGSPVHLRRAIHRIRGLFRVVAARGVDLTALTAETAPFRVPAWLGGLILHTTLRSNPPARLVWETGEDEERDLIVAEVARWQAAVRPS